VTDNPIDSSSSPDEVFRLFFRANHDRLVGFIARRIGDWHSAEQVAQEVMLKVLLQFTSVRVPEALMFHIASCRVSNWWRGKGRQPLDLLADMTELGVVLAEREFTSSEIIHRGLRYALRELPWRQQQAITLRFLDDLEFHEVATLMGISATSAQRTVARAPASLRKSAHLAPYLPVPEVRK
jgi:RNA polymerase sigma-70 factor (ECF subfamily)